MGSFNVRSDAADYLSRVRSRSWWGDWERASAQAMSSMSGDPISAFMANAGSYSDWDAEGQALAQGQIDWINKQKADQELLGGIVSVSPGTWESVGDVAEVGAVAGLAAGAAYAGYAGLAAEAGAGAAEGAAAYSELAAAESLAASEGLAALAPYGEMAAAESVAASGEFGGIGELANLGAGGAASGEAAPIVSSFGTTDALAHYATSNYGLAAAQAAPMLFGLAAGGPEMPQIEDGAARPDAGKENPATVNRERAMELRRAAASRAAEAAGARRFGNDADLLGSTSRPTQRRKANERRRLLGD